MATYNTYNYDKVKQRYEQISSEKGHLLNFKEIDNCSVLPSSSWFIKHGGIEKIRDDLGFKASNSDFCNDCTENPCSCDYKPDSCPLMKEADLYFLDVDFYHKSYEKTSRKKYERINLSEKDYKEAIRLKKSGLNWEKVGETMGIKYKNLYQKVKKWYGKKRWENRGWK